LAPDRVRKIGRNLLACGWRVLPVLDAEQQTTTRRVGEGDAILDQLVPVGALADHGPQGLLVEELAFLAQTAHSCRLLFIVLLHQSSTIRNSVASASGRTARVSELRCILTRPWRSRWRRVRDRLLAARPDHSASSNTVRGCRSCISRSSARFSSDSRLAN